MCRWFAYISPEEPCLLSDVLIEPPNAIAKQYNGHDIRKLISRGNGTEIDKQLNIDGFGIAWYSDVSDKYYTEAVIGPRPALYKSQQPPTNDFNGGSLCRNIETKCVLAHIRATPGPGSIVNQVNCHPFVFGRHAFMHNGGINKFITIKKDINSLLSDDTFSSIRGDTDTEHAAALYITYLTKDDPKDDTKDDTKNGTKNGTKNVARVGTISKWEKEYSIEAMRDALLKTITTILELQKKRGALDEANHLNFCATDGQRMIATRFCNHVAVEPPSLYWSKSAGTKLNHGCQEPGMCIREHTIVASEQTTRNKGWEDIKDKKQCKKCKGKKECEVCDECDGWNVIGKNYYLTVDERGTVTHEKIVYGQDFDADVKP